MQLLLPRFGSEDVKQRIGEINVQLLTFPGCPLAEAARVELQSALAECAGIDYAEIDILDPGSDENLRGWGSPTILIDGADITGQPKGDDVGCRVYPGNQGVPLKDEILAAVRRRKRT